MIRVEGLNVGANAGGPVGDHGGGAAGAARFITQFPGEDGAGCLVAIYNQFDPCFVGGL